MWYVFVMWIMVSSVGVMKNFMASVKSSLLELQQSDWLETFNENMTRNPTKLLYDVYHVLSQSYRYQSYTLLVHCVFS